MNKEYLTEAVTNTKATVRNALQTMYDALNQGQQKQIVKNEEVRSLFDLHGVNYNK